MIKINLDDDVPFNQFETIDQVWKAIDSGITIYWKTTAYELTIKKTNVEWFERLGYKLPFSNRDEKCLRVTCVSNWFGSSLVESDLKHLFTKGA